MIYSLLLLIDMNSERKEEINKTKKTIYLMCISTRKLIFFSTIPLLDKHVAEIAASERIMSSYFINKCSLLSDSFRFLNEITIAYIILTFETSSKFPVT